MGKSRVISFFEKYASEYDWLTNAADRVPGHSREVERLIGRFQPERVLDAGCATGLTAFLFASKGVMAVGLDRSRAMLTVARKKYSSTDLCLNFRSGSFQSLPKDMDQSFDLVVCLANSIAGVESRANLARSLKGFRRALRPGGNVVLQALNIDALKDGEIAPVRTTEHGVVVYSRFLERSLRKSILYVLRLEGHGVSCKTELFRHESVSFTPSILGQALAKAGFVNIRRYGDLMMTKRFSAGSRDIVMVAQRPRRAVR